MRKFAAMLGIVALALAGSMAVAEDKKVETWSGWITDEQCGAKNANADGAACALKCHKAGSKLVLYTMHEKELIQLDNQEEAVKHVGHPVTITGTYENGTIKVTKIEEKKS